MNTKNCSKGQNSRRKEAKGIGQSGKVKMVKKWGKLIRKKVALTDTRQKKLLTQISPQNITAGAWESHWRELSQVSFLSPRKFCHRKHLFVMTKDIFLSWQTQKFCRDKYIGAACHSDWQWMQNNGHLLSPCSFKKVFENPLKVHLGDKYPLKLCMKTPYCYLWTHVQPWPVSHYQTPKH